MKNLLMVIPFFPPNAGGGVYRPLSFVKYLGDHGWRPTVLTMDSAAYWIADESLVPEVPSTCVVHRTKTLSGQAVLSGVRRRGGSASKEKRTQVRSSRGFGVLRKLGAAALMPDTYVGWYPFAVREGKKILGEGSFDAVYSTSPPETSHLIALHLSAIAGLPWVADFRDPWMNLHLLPCPSPLHRRIHRRLEKRVCARASVVVTATPWHRDLILKSYPAMAPVELIRNGYDPAEIDRLAGFAPPSDVFQIVHAGMLTQKRSAAIFLEALKAFLDEVPGARERCRVVFLGPRESENDAAAGALGLADVVSFRDTVSHAEALKIERSSHVLVLIKNNDPLYDGVVPGKLYEYIGVGRPILALAPEGDAAAIVRAHGRGEVAPPGDVGKIAAAIETLYRKYRAGTLDTEYDLSPVSEFRRDVLAAKLAGLLDGLLGGIAGRPGSPAAKRE
jgi:glycosyltransferase involved in cell wall biosynthesis